MIAILSNESKPLNPQLREPGDDLRELYFSRGDGVNDERMTFKGTLKAINAALNHLSYVGGADFNGDDTITIQANDMGQYKSSTPSQPGLNCVGYFNQGNCSKR